MSEPTNVTGSAVSTDVPKPLKPIWRISLKDFLKRNVDKTKKS